MKESGGRARSPAVAFARQQQYLDNGDVGTFSGNPGDTLLGPFFSVEGYTEATVHGEELFAGDGAQWLELAIGFANENDQVVNLTTVVATPGSGWIGAGFNGAVSFSFARTALIYRECRLRVRHTNNLAVDPWNARLRMLLRGRPVYGQGFRV